MVVEGEEVKASAQLPGPGATAVRIDAVKADGTPVLTGTAAIGPTSGETELAPRLAKAKANPPQGLVILDRLSVGQRGAPADVVETGADVHHGDLYPFTLADKLATMTEHLTVHDPVRGSTTPWGCAVVPVEMLSVLANRGSKSAGFEVRQPSLGLFIDLEVRLLGRPVLVGRRYRVEREIVALAESRRTESYWTLNTLVDEADGIPTAEVLLHQGVFKESYPGHPEGAAG
jgi:hypothetical protein